MFFVEDIGWGISKLAFIEGIADLEQALPRANGVSSHCQHLPVRNLVGHVNRFRGPLYGSPLGPAMVDG